MITVHSQRVDSGRLSATVDGIPGWDGFSLWFDADASYPIGDPFLASLLPVAMSLGVPLEVCSPVSKVLLRQLPQIQQQWARWHDWPLIKVRAEGIERVKTGNGIGCFFSGGVDSFYSLLKLLASDSKPTHLIFAHGFDIPLSSIDRYAMVRGHIEVIAKELGVETVFPSSNIRELTNAFCDWGVVQHGPSLAALALTMQHRFASVVVPATFTFAEQFPWGSHPMIDPLWSTEVVAITHHGCEATRVQKVQHISESRVALDNVRVCWKVKDGSYNCGKCEKCIRTMTNLVVAGSLGRCKTFPEVLTADQLAKAVSDLGHHSLVFARENLDGLRAAQTRQDLQQVLEDALSRRSYRALVKDLIRHVDKSMLRGTLRKALS